MLISKFDKPLNPFHFDPCRVSSDDDPKMSSLAPDQPQPQPRPPPPLTLIPPHIILDTNCPFPWPADTSFTLNSTSNNDTQASGSGSGPGNGAGGGGYTPLLSALGTPKVDEKEGFVWPEPEAGAVNTSVNYAGAGSVAGDQAVDGGRGTEDQGQEWVKRRYLETLYYPEVRSRSLAPRMIWANDTPHYHSLSHYRSYHPSAPSQTISPA